MEPATGVPPPASVLPLQIEGLRKRFGELAAVDGVTLDLNSGECLGLLGPNGAGKSTVIRSIVGRVVADEGRVSVLGCPADSAGARAALGWVPQELAIYPLLTCRENLDSFGRYHGLRGGALKAATAWCLDWAALTERAAEIVKHLSGGMKRRLNMAVGLVHRPKVVLLDEPTVGVDPQSRNRIFEMIERLRAEGMSAVYTTHYIEEAERLCDRVAIIDHGRIIAMGTRDDLVRTAFASRSEVLVQFATANGGAAGWVRSQGGRYDAGKAQFMIEHPREILGLLDAAAKAGHELADVSLRKPNLESVFLRLTGRELRD
jgi:ABC-2 type transport system ATP-binding protein